MLINIHKSDLISFVMVNHGPLFLSLLAQHPGSDKWTLQEKRQLNKALLIHNKDFHLIQTMVNTLQNIYPWIDFHCRDCVIISVVTYHTKTSVLLLGEDKVSSSVC